MSIRSVNSQINKALQDKVLTQCEAQNIVETAEHGRLTTGETKAISDLYTEGQWYMPNTFPHGALPQPRPPQYELEDGAAQTLQSFFIANKVPQGEAYGTTKTEIEFALKDFDYSCQLDAAPNTKHLHHVFLKDQRPLDGNRTDAFVNTEKQEFYLKVTGAGMAGPDTVGPYWYGPLKLNEVAETDVVKDKISAYDVARDTGLRTSRTHTPRVTDVVKNDDGTFTATVSAINWRDPSDVIDTKQAIVDAEGQFISAVDANTGITDATRAKMMDALAAAKSGTYDFNNNGLPMGVRYERVLLEKEPGFDTYTYTALVPGGAIYPGADATDPNEASHIFIERSGGFAGWTQVAGPISLDDLD